MNFIIINTICTVLLLFVSVATILAEDSGYKGFKRGTALITAKELKKKLDGENKNLIVLAAESDVEYRLGHIPGSHQVDRPAIEAAPETQNGITGNIIDAAGFTRLARSLGINRDTTVVIYDTKYDATRLWWAFTYYGKNNIRLLDGGVKAWRDAGYTVDLFAPDKPQPGSYTASIAKPTLRVDTADILRLKTAHSSQLWDARDRKEYCGEELKKGAVRAGRIPWGIHSPWLQFKKKENQAEWLSAAEVKSVIEKLGYDPAKEQYFYCQSGVRSTQAIFALYLSGWPLERLHNYDSSWIGWSRDQRLPIDSGCSENVASEVSLTNK